MNNEDIEIIDDRKITNIFKDKKIIAIICGVVVGIIILLLLFFVFNDNKSKLNKELESVGRHFYEEFYYSQAGNSDSEKKSFLSAFTSAGIKVDLENLSRGSDDKDEVLNKFVNAKTGEKCDINNTKVTIYPKDPFGQKDYTIETTLDCGFDK